MSENPPRPPKVENNVEAPKTPPIEKQSGEPIVMLNPVLNRIAGLKEKPKRKERKSIPNGGEVYKPMVLESTFGEESLGKEAQEKVAESMEGPKMQPETVREQKEALKTAVSSLTALQIDSQMQYLRQKISAAEQEAKGGSWRESARSKARPSLGSTPLEGAANDNQELPPEERIQKFEAQLKALEQEKGLLNPKYVEKEEKETPAVSAAPAKSPESPARAKPAASKKKGSNWKVALGVGAVLGGMAATEVAAMGSRHERAPVPAESTQYKNFEPVTSFIQKNEGAYEMILKLRSQLRIAFPDVKHAPLIVQNILDHSRNVETLAYAYGFTSRDGTRSIILHTGDTPEKADSLSVNDKGQLVFRQHGKDHILLEEVSKGKLGQPKPLDQPLHLTGHHPHHYQETHHAPANETHHAAHPATHAAQPTPVVTATRQAAPDESDALNKTEVGQWNQTRENYAVHTVHEGAQYTPKIEPSPERVEPPRVAAPVEAPAPPAPEAPRPVEPIRPPVESAPSVTNAHGLEIHPDKAEIYQTKDGRLVAYGGTFEQRFNAARDYVTANKNQVVLFDSSFKSPDGPEMIPSLGGFSSSASGSVEAIPGSLTDGEGKAIPIPTADDLVKKP